MTLEEMRNIVHSQMPYDTGFMFLSGARFFDTSHFLLTVYDTERVPYIIYNEEGTRYTTKNKGFISERTVGALNRFSAFLSTGERADAMNSYREIGNRRGSTDMIKQGALDKIGGEMNG